MIRYKEKLLLIRMVKHKSPRESSSSPLLEDLKIQLDVSLSNLTHLDLLWSGSWTRELWRCPPASVMLWFCWKNWLVCGQRNQNSHVWWTSRSIYMIMTHGCFKGISTLGRHWHLIEHLKQEESIHRKKGC